MLNLSPSHASQGAWYQHHQEATTVAESMDGIYLSALPPGAVLELETKMHCYRIEHLDGDHVRISGHPTICPAPLPVHLDGSMKHRDHIERGFIGRGMRLMFSRPEEGLSVTTSEIVSLRIIPGGSSERRSEGGRGAP
jgi:hypothetical protein